MAEIDWRRIDVDQFDEDKLTAAELFTNARPPQTTDASVVTAAVRQAIARGDASGGLRQGLGIADLDPTAALSCLSSIKSTEIPQVLAQLSRVELDQLMRAIYKGLASPAANNCAVLLSWHEKVVEIGGEGVIVRVLTYRAA
ncbi:arp2/3 complex subunit [Savitreella phatthalungensis]